VHSGIISIRRKKGSCFGEIIELQGDLPARRAFGAGFPGTGSELDFAEGGGYPDTNSTALLNKRIRTAHEPSSSRARLQEGFFCKELTSFSGRRSVYMRGEADNSLLEEGYAVQIED
jgi:hypothetical protein